MQILNFIEIAKLLMIKLSEKTGETINLCILDGVDIICVEKIESKYYLKLDQPIGSRAKAYHTDMGEAILAYLSEQERARLFSKHTLSPGTSKSLKTVNAIEEDLQRVREQGYSVDNEEYILGVRRVGAPIFDHNSKVVAGVSIAGPSSRVKEENIEFLAKQVTETAASISRGLGVFHGGVVEPPYRVTIFDRGCNTVPGFLAVYRSIKTCTIFHKSRGLLC